MSTCVREMSSSHRVSSPELTATVKQILAIKLAPKNEVGTGQRAKKLEMCELYIPRGGKNSTTTKTVHRGSEK